MTTNIVIPLPDDAEEAVRLLRAELRAARRRRALAREATARATYRRLPLSPLTPIPDRGPRP
jgi:hypothetical protein